MNLADAKKEIKKELSSDEKVLEHVFKLETYYKKYKYIIWAVVIGLIVYFFGRAYMQSVHTSKMLEANEAFLSLQKNQKDTEALEILKAKNPKLYELFVYTQAVQKEDIAELKKLGKSENAIVADASSYAASVLERKPKDSELYKEMSSFQQAYLAIKSGNLKEAKQKLSSIEENSPLYMLASLLKHYTIKAK